MLASQSSQDPQLNSEYLVVRASSVAHRCFLFLAALRLSLI